MHTRLRSLTVFTLLLLTAAAGAQVGTIAAVKNSSSSFSIINPSSGAVTTHNIGAFLPGSGATAGSILFESASVFLRRWLVSGNGFIGRISFSVDILNQTTTLGYSVLATGIPANQLIAKDPAGNILFADTTNDQVMKVSPAGAVSNVTSGSQPWGNGLLSGALHPVSGELLLGSAGGQVFRLAPGSTTASLFGPSQPLSQSRVESVVADPLSTGVVALVKSTVSGAFNRFVRIGVTGTVQDLLPIAAIDGFGLAVNPTGDFLLSMANGTILRVPNGGGAQFVVAIVTSPAFPAMIQGLAVQGSLRSVLPYLSVTAPAAGSVDIDLLNCDSGNTFRLLVSLQPTHPTASGPAFGVGMDAFPQLFAPVIFGTVGANGTGHVGFTGVPGGVSVDAVALEVTPALLLAGVSNVVAFTTL